MSSEQRDYLRGMLMGLIGLAGLGLTIATARKGGRDWVPTDSEARAIADPLANIAWRHGPEELSESTDLVDGIAVAAATGAYAVRALSGAPGGGPAVAATSSMPPGVVPPEENP